MTPITLATWNFVWVATIALASTGLVAVPLIAFEGFRRSLPFIAVIFGVAFLGGTAGFLGGLSREGVVGDLVPAAFTLLGGLSIYLFGLDRSKGLMATFGCVGFCAAFAYSYLLSANVRGENDMRSTCIAIYSNADLLSEAAAFDRADRIFGPTCRPLFETVRGDKA